MQRYFMEHGKKFRVKSQSTARKKKKTEKSMI